MNFLHYDLRLDKDEVVEVSLDKQANVRLLDDVNFSHFRSGKEHRFIGGLAKKSPVRITAPGPGHWHLVVDLGGYGGTVRAGFKTHKPSGAPNGKG